MNLPKLFDLSGRVAVVTGGAGLLGSQFCHTLAEAGAAVVIADLNLKVSERLANSLSTAGHRSLAHQTDVTDASSIHKMVQECINNFGRLDILVNSAALDPKFDPGHSARFGSSAFEDFPLDAWEQALRVNITGAFLCCQAAVIPMLSQGGGVIINLASIYGLVAPNQQLYQRPGEPAQYKPVYYSVSKAAILGLTRYLSAYYAGRNIRVNSLTPGGVYNQHDEEFTQAYAAHTIIGRMAEKDELNGALLFLASDASKYMTGANLVVDGGWTTW